MKKLTFISNHRPVLIYLLSVLLFLQLPLVGQRVEVDLSGQGWSLWRDEQATWKEDELFLPPVDLRKIPVNPPTIGWENLKPQKGIPVSVPGTAEEYLGDGKCAKGELYGVTWWYREIAIPKATKPTQFILKFEAARLRAEVYVNEKLAGYDLVGNTPFDVDITSFVRPGEMAKIAVRITNPNGNYDWYDVVLEPWGKYKIPQSHGFGGITGGVKLVGCSPTFIDDLYLQNTPHPQEVNAHISIQNKSSEKIRQNLMLTVFEKKNPSREVFQKELKNVEVPPGESKTTIQIIAPEAKLWDLDHPELYTCRVELIASQNAGDKIEKSFGFRWFTPEKQGENAVFRLNGKRIVVRTAISWGFWPINGIFPTESWAQKQISVAKQFGLNMLNFHRCMGHTIVLEKADEMGLLYYAEPGGYVAGGKDPFAQALAREKLFRMVKSFRSHPSLVIYNMINEGWPKYYQGANDQELFQTHVADMKGAHSLDPSRTITYASAWAKSYDQDEKPKMHMRPYDEKVYQQGWWDLHRAGGRECWREDFYKGPGDHYGFSDNKKEIVYFGEDGAISTPPLLGTIKKELDASPQKGWDGKSYLEWYQAFEDFLKEKNLLHSFPTVDDLCKAMGVISIEHQGRKIEDHRICDTVDGYAINGWEAQILDNHSGVVDGFRNPKADPAIMAYYNQPLYIAVKTRNQVAHLGESITVDFYAINEKDLRGNYTLKVTAQDSQKKELFSKTYPVQLQGGDRYGELLVEGVAIPMNGAAGMTQVRGSLTNNTGEEKAKGHDQILAVDWKSSKISGKGAILESEGKIRNFLKEQKHIDIPAYTGKEEALDWIIVARSLAKDPVIIASQYLRDLTGEKEGLNVTFFADRDFKKVLYKRTHDKVDFNWDGQTPDPEVKIAENYCVRWEGFLVPPTSGKYVLSVSRDDGARLWVNQKQVIDAWKPGSPPNTQRAEIDFVAGAKVPIVLEYFQNQKNAEIQFKWIPPGTESVDPLPLLAAAKNHGTRLILMDNAKDWMTFIQQSSSIQYNGDFGVGLIWVGGQYFVKEHPLFKNLPVNVGLSWPYQAVIKGERTGLRLKGEELVVGCQNNAPFELGTAVGIIPYGKGKILFSTLNIADQLKNPAGPAHVARKLFCNYLEWVMR